MRSLKDIFRVLAVLAFCAWAPVAVAAAPKVVESTPQNGGQNVDPALKELRVVFDQPMAPNGWSVTGAGPMFPKLVGTARWENDRTFVWAWSLEPEHDYRFGVNSRSHTNFRSANGEAAVPFVIGFRTAPAAGATGAIPAAPPASNREAVARLKRAINEAYSYRDLRVTDWDQRFKTFAPQLESARTRKQFAELAAQLLSPAQDVHLWLKVGEETVPTFRRSAPWNVAAVNLPRQTPHWQQRSSTVCTGAFGDGIRYLFIRNWPSEADGELDPAFEAVWEAAEAGKPLIIDVRANGGGSEPLAQQLAGCFVDRPAVYAKHVIRRNGAFGEPQNRVLEPNKVRPRFRGRVVVLMGQGTVSSCESFVMMMKQAPDCTLVGDPTAGSSGNPQPVDLGNGIVAFVPSWKDLRLDGTCLEGEGFAPDVAVKTSPSDFEKNDPVLEAALKLLHTPK